jgi:hypothetical protein
MGRRVKASVDFHDVGVDAREMQSVDRKTGSLRTISAEAFQFSRGPKRTTAATPLDVHLLE